LVLINKAVLATPGQHYGNPYDQPPRGSSVQLPHGWSQQHDQNTGRTYYINETTNVSQWEQPAAATRPGSLRTDQGRDQNALASNKPKLVNNGPWTITTRKSGAWTKSSLLTGGIFGVGLSHAVPTSKIIIKYDASHTRRKFKRNQDHKYAKERFGWGADEWFTIRHVADMDNNCVHAYITGMKDRWIYYKELDAMKFIKHLLDNPIYRCTGCGVTGQKHQKKCVEPNCGEWLPHPPTGLKECFPDCPCCSGGGCGSCNNLGIVPDRLKKTKKTTSVGRRFADYWHGVSRRRLVEAAYYSFIGFNMILACALLVGICFAYRIGTHEAKYEPIRW